MHNFHGYTNARKRRHERRKEQQEVYNKDINMALKTALNPEEITIPTRPVLSLNRKAMDRVNKEISVQNTPNYDKLNNCCLSNAALYSTKTKTRRHLESGGVTARA
ncbi:hypothetical protein [Xenorhabdus bovienii]|uniref:Uncharacterized protein n=1 Tax=Xenorhabdus bovienii TaxID=40576 RepID=A0AAJ1MZN9_XENBV|nr:hypothetical protein [Xenorhabdus bovienii]MDE1477267.1 hypothetical protein [Xenorhabdus bovienii]MDE1489705.1 hypothetical protein [Xenorhabdus bovienii]MDE1493656.1 hypothetical protein [Xenorhabdus bovienii]MDE9457196.1 hypothetical protein [Xenorhabdus bovienii]MDE9463824.1 hypothetical protein [Xenorhabdus bovienii]